MAYVAVSPTDARVTYAPERWKRHDTLITMRACSLFNCLRNAQTCLDTHDVGLDVYAELSCAIHLKHTVCKRLLRADYFNLYLFRLIEI